MILLIQAGSFAGGMYAGKEYLGTPKQNQSFNNYTTPKEVSPQPQTQPTSTTSTTSDCPIKGNISSKSKIYHIQGGSFYERTTPEMCFSTEAEAQAAGFTKSSR